MERVYEPILGVNQHTHPALPNRSETDRFQDVTYLLQEKLARMAGSAGAISALNLRH